MSKRPPKKSDMNKGWMKPRRDKVKKIQPEYHLIVTEGEQTEPEYFKAIKNLINSKYRGRVQLDIYGEGDNTLGLFERARKRAKESPNIYKHIWLVYDTDDFPSENINLTKDFCINATQMSGGETEYHAVWSNQCIELWFLLHFSYLQSDLHRSEYGEKLTNHLKSIGKEAYSKNRKDMFEILRPYMKYAINNAKKLDGININKTPAKSAPGTKVYELVENLLPYLTD